MIIIPVLATVIIGVIVYIVIGGIDPHQPIWPITKGRPKPPSLEDFEKWNDLHVQAIDQGMDEPEAVKFADKGLYTFKRMRGTTPPIGEMMKEFYLPQPKRPSPIIKTLR